MNYIKRGKIYYADLSPAVGNEAGGLRPVLVLSTNIDNSDSMSIIAPITSKKQTEKHPTTVIVDGESCGMISESAILISQMRAFDNTRLKDYMATLDEDKLQEVDNAIRLCFGLI